MTTEKYIERTVTSGGGGGADNSKTLNAQEYLHGAKAGAGVPLLRSSLTGLVVAFPFLVLMLKLRTEDAWYWAAGIWGVVQALVWIAIQFHLFSLTNLEKLTGKDLNRDGVIGEKSSHPAKQVVQVNLREVRANGHITGTRYVEFPASDMQMATLASALLGGASLAERSWSGEGKLFAQDNFREIRTIMIKNKLIELRNAKDPRQGFILTDDGKQTMERIRDNFMANSPPPPGEDA